MPGRLSLAEVKEELSRLAALLGARPDQLPAFSWDGHPNEFAIHIDEQGYHLFFDDSGREIRKWSFEEPEDLYYEVLSNLASEMASKWELGTRAKGVDDRRLWFARQEELLAKVRPSWGDRKRKEHAAILARHPFDDQLAKRADRWGELMAQGMPREQAVAQATREFPDSPS